MVTSVDSGIIAFGGLAAHIDVADILGFAPVVGIRLNIDAKQTAETVEVVHVACRRYRRHRLKHLVDRYPEFTRLFAVEIDFDLGIMRVEGCEEIGQLRPFTRRFEELPRCSPSCCTFSEPLRSWSRKLKPADAPNPEIVGILNGKMTASEIFG